MENSPQINNNSKSHEILFKVTSLSRYLALALFIVLPFIGGYIGYLSSPEKIIEVPTEKIVHNKLTDNTRFVEPDGYIINNELFFSPSMGIMFKGFLENITFTGTAPMLINPQR